MLYHVRGISAVRDSIRDSADADPAYVKDQNGVCLFLYVNVEILAKSSIFIKNLLF